MFCKTCGQKCSSPGSYCLNDGAFLSRERVDFKSNGKRKFCHDCGTEGGPQQNYCLSCGANLNLYTKKVGNALPEATKKVQVQPAERATKSVVLPKFSIDYIKAALFPALISIFLLTVVSFGVLKMSQSNLSDLFISEELREMTNFLESMALEADGDLLDLTNIIGVTDSMMYANLQGSSFEFMATSSSGGTEAAERYQARLDLPNGSILYMFIPFVSLFVGGMVLGARNRKKQLSLLGLNLSMALIYGAVLAVIAIFAGFSYQSKVSTDFLSATIQMENNYSLISSLILGGIFAFIFCGLGILFSYNYRKITGHLPEIMPFGEAVHQAFSTVVRGMGLLFVLFILYFSTKVNEWKENAGLFLPGSGVEALFEKSSVFVLALSAQVSNYVWNLLHLAPLNFLIKNDSGEFSVVYSVMKGLTSSGGKDFENALLHQLVEGSDIGLYLKIALFLPILLFIWAGYQLAKRQEHLLTQVAVFSLIYALFMGGLAAITDLGFAASISEAGYGSEQAGASLGFSAWGVLTRSFLFAFIFSYAGTWVRKLKS